MSIPLERGSSDGLLHEITTPIDPSLVPYLPLTLEYTQVGHGFSELTPVYWDGVEWIAALADDFDTLSTYVVVEVIDDDNFIVGQVGQFDISAHGLTPGDIYYLSPTTAGALTTIQPTEGYVQPILFPEDGDVIHLTNQGPANLEALGARASINGFGEAFSVPASTETDVASYVVSAGQKFTFKGATCSGSADGEFRVKIDGVPQCYQRSAWTNRNVDFRFEVTDIAAGIIVKVTVVHTELTAQDFYANIHGETINL